MEHKYHKTAAQLEAEYAEVKKACANPKDFSVLYERYYDSIFGFVWKRLEDEEATADITQIVFLKAMIHLKKFEFRGLPFSSWLFRIAVNEVNMYFRKHPGQRIISMEESQAFHLAAEVRDQDREETLKIVLRLLQKLEPEDLQLIELRFFEEMSFAEIGEIFSITENNAKVRTYRALSKLKKLVDNETPRY
ncbi:MAG: sigma-70 family RNA polymerase sigma factor [Bacteroidia bacterium]|nr:sigma-70 family RNA polymerase sigma factor [Bacteroidia bacterium]